MIQLDKHTQDVLQARYLVGEEKTVEDVFERVARVVSEAERQYCQGDASVESWRQHFANMMKQQKFVPNSPLLWSAGVTNNPFACFVLPIEDSRESIFDTLTKAVIIESHGGGVGFNWSNLRAKGSLIKGNGGRSSGLISFMTVYDVAMGEVVKQGKRGGAMIGILECIVDKNKGVAHPDIEEFILSKRNNKALQHFNISVMVDDLFMKAVEEDGDIVLSHPKSDGTPNQNKVVKAREIWNKLCSNAWEFAEPGLLFIDNMNKGNLRPELLRVTNPCGEVMLPIAETPYGSGGGCCNLGSINLAKFVDVETHVFDEKDFRNIVALGVRFLDDVIDIANYSLKSVEYITKEERRLGLGIMGFADACIMMNIRYGSQECLDFIDKVGKIFDEEATITSGKLAHVKGTTAFVKECCEKNGVPVRRNIACTTIAPTGTISMFAQCSAGCEPVFEFEHERNDTIGKSVIFHPLYQKYKDSDKFDKKIWVSSNEVSLIEHVMVQATWQKYIHNNISKTMNAPKTTTLEEVKNAFMLAWKNGVKGITFYRDGSIANQVLSKVTDDKDEDNVVKRPKSLPCEIHKSKVKGSDWCVVLGIYDEKPYEVFAFPEEYMKFKPELVGKITKVTRGNYELESNGDRLIMTKDVMTHEQAEITRLVSMSLRHNVPLHFIVDQLEKSQGQMNCMSRAIARVLKRFVKDGTRVTGMICPTCGSEKIARYEGCVTCRNCDWKKCA